MAVGAVTEGPIVQGPEPTTEPRKTVYRLGEIAGQYGLTWDRAERAEANERTLAATLAATVQVIDRHPEWGQSITWIEDAQAIEQARLLVSAYDPEYHAPDTEG